MSTSANGGGAGWRPVARDIPLASRIILIADAFEALVADRRYRKSVGRDVAIRELQEHCGTQFDPELVRAFISMLTAHPEF